MNPLQYINKIFCTLLFFSTGNKSYSQREIHPLEPMFTYDYALKYYQNIGIRNDFVKDFWLIDNFKASSDLEIVEVYGIENYPKSGELIHSGNIKHVYFYDSTTGFLKKSMILALNNNYKTIKTLEERQFKYNIDNLHTTINVERVVFGDKTKKYKQQYIYDENEYLSGLITEDNDTIRISYSANKNTEQIIHININGTINVLKYNQSISSKSNSNYTVPNDQLHYRNRIEDSPTVLVLENQFLDRVKYNNYEITYHYRELAFAGASYYLSKKGTLLFNEQHQLVDYKIEQIPFGKPNFSPQPDPVSTTTTIKTKRTDDIFIDPNEFKKTYYKRKADDRWRIITSYPNGNNKKMFTETKKIKKDRIVNKNRAFILYK